MYPYGFHFFRGQADPIVGDIAKAINGQYSAAICYEKLADMAPCEEEKDRILEIRRDELRHLQTFVHLYTSLTGAKPSPKQTEPCAKDYLGGLVAALEDEQETVDFYLDISDKARDPRIKEAFRRAAHDEQNHAVWFLYFYTKHCCQN